MYPLVLPYKHLKEIQMPSKSTPNKIKKQSIEAYLLPELENIKALLEGLNLVQSLQALIFLENILKNELQKYGG